MIHNFLIHCELKTLAPNQISVGTEEILPLVHIGRVIVLKKQFK